MYLVYLILYYVLLSIVLIYKVTKVSARYPSLSWKIVKTRTVYPEHSVEFILQTYLVTTHQHTWPVKINQYPRCSAPPKLSTKLLPSTPLQISTPLPPAMLTCVPTIQSSTIFILTTGSLDSAHEVSAPQTE